MTIEQKDGAGSRVLSSDELDIIAEVNAELEESMARIRAAGEPVRQGDKAHDDFLELVIYGNKVPAVANFSISSSALARE